MSDVPIIFSGRMVRALLDGYKTMTRRLALRNAKPAAKWSFRQDDKWVVKSSWQRVKPGDRLWVRESLRKASPEGHWLYAADGAIILMEKADPRVTQMIGWVHHKETDHAPPIHMPRWTSRLTLIVTATKIERLQAISDADAIAEGCGVDIHHPHPEVTREPFPVQAFCDLWTDLHGGASWDSNPEVVAVAFTVHKKNIDTLPKAEAA